MSASLSARSFPFTPVCQRQYTHRSFGKWMSTIDTFQYELSIPFFSFCSKLIISKTKQKKIKKQAQSTQRLKRTCVFIRQHKTYTQFHGKPPFQATNKTYSERRERERERRGRLGRGGGREKWCRGIESGICANKIKRNNRRHSVEPKSPPPLLAFFWSTFHPRTDWTESSLRFTVGVQDFGLQAKHLGT